MLQFHVFFNKICLRLSHIHLSMNMANRPKHVALLNKINYFLCTVISIYLMCLYFYIVSVTP